MKKFLQAIGIFVAVIICLASIVHIARSDDEVTYTVTYRAIEDGTERNVRSYLFDSKKSYPKEVSEGEALHVDDLRGKMTYEPWVLDDGTVLQVAGGSGYVDPNDSTKEYEFLGWYTDKACSKAFVNDREIKGDLVLYAKINVSHWSEWIFTPDYPAME